MDQVKVDQMLKDYKLNVGRCEYLSILLDEMRNDAKEWHDHLTEDLANATSGNNGMPRSSEVSNPTERIGLLLTSGFVPEDLAELEKQIRSYEEELREKNTNIRCVNAWLNGLTEKECWIVQSQVINGDYWREIISGYRRKYGEDYTKDGLKRIRDAALKKIYSMAA